MLHDTSMCVGEQGHKMGREVRIGFYLSIRSRLRDVSKKNGILRTAFLRPTVLTLVPIWKCFPMEHCQASCASLLPRRLGLNPAASKLRKSSCCKVKAGSREWIRPCLAAVDLWLHSFPLQVLETALPVAALAIGSGDPRLQNLGDFISFILAENFSLTRWEPQGYC